MPDPRGWHVDPETLREVPHDAAAMLSLLAELREATDGDPAALALREERGEAELVASTRIALARVERALRA